MTADEVRAAVTQQVLLLTAQGRQPYRVRLGPVAIQALEAAGHSTRSLVVWLAPGPTPTSTIAGEGTPVVLSVETVSSVELIEVLDT